MWMSSPQGVTRRALDGMRHAVPDDGASHAWDRQVAREVQHQARIEAAFDRSDAFDRLGYRAQALRWLDAAEALGGDLPPLYRAKRARFAELARRDRSGGKA